MPPSASETGSARLCWPGRPAAACRAFIVNEASIGLRVARSQGRYEGVDDEELEGYEAYVGPPVYVIAELGWMYNHRPGSAVGVSVFGGPEFGYEEIQYGVKGRYRRWLDDNAAIDVSIGTLLGTGYNHGQAGAHNAGWESCYHDLIGLDLGFDRRSAGRAAACVAPRISAPRRHWTEYSRRGYVMLRTGSGLALAAYGAAGLVGLMAFAYQSAW